MAELDISFLQDGHIASFSSTVEDAAGVEEEVEVTGVSNVNLTATRDFNLMGNSERE